MHDVAGTMHAGGISPEHVGAAAGRARVRKLYWAVVEGGGALPDAGELRAAVPGGAGTDAGGSAASPGLETPPGPRLDEGAAGERAALTRYCVRARRNGLSWLELEPITGSYEHGLLACMWYSTVLLLSGEPSPSACLAGLSCTVLCTGERKCQAVCVFTVLKRNVTCVPVAAGRKHQLRLHCAHELRAPILGDGRYGNARDAVAAAAAPPAVSAAASALQLHCRQVSRQPLA